MKESYLYSTNSVTNLGGVELRYVQHKIINKGKAYLSAKKLHSLREDKIITYKRKELNKINTWKRRWVGIII